jgi:acyl transferase domain-containing protein/thioesterase domain-containing protein
MNSASEPPSTSLSLEPSLAEQSTGQLTGQSTGQNYDIAIIGLAGRFPGATNIAEFWDNLQAGRDCITFLSDRELREAAVPEKLLAEPNYVKAAGIIADRDRFDAAFFGFTAKEATLIDPQHRLFLEEAWTALEHAGYNPETYPGAIGVYAGVGTNSYLLNYLYPSLLATGDADRYEIQRRNDKDFLPTLVSYKLNLRGASLAVQTACSTSLVAIHLACQSLLGGECDITLAGSSTVVANPTGYLYDAQNDAQTSDDGIVLSPDGHCRVFDAKAQGTVGGSGVGVVVLKRLADAIADGDTIHAVIKGSAVNHDGARKEGHTAPSVEGQAAVITEAQAVAGVSAETITYIEAHGTGTVLGDPIELAALTHAFRQQTERTGFCGIGSVKSNVGHLDTAAGIAGLIKTVAALQHRLLPPSLHFEQPNPALNLSSSPFYVNTKVQPWVTQDMPRRAGVSSFGVGGTNVHVILEEAPMQSASSPSSRSTHLLLLSARSESALDRLSQQLAAHLHHLQQQEQSDQTDHSLADIAYTLSVGRKAFEYRRAVACRTYEEAIRGLQSSDLQPSESLQSEEPSEEPVPIASGRAIASEVAFLLPGQGTQYIGMGYELYQSEPVFWAALDECAQLLEPMLNLDIRECLYPDAPQIGQSNVLLQQTALTQPILFAVEYALARLWLSWGVTPQALIGQGIGEYVAACLAGVFSLVDGLWLVANRGYMIQQMPSGAMLTVALSESEVQSWLSPEIALAAVEGDFCTVAGSVGAIDRLQVQLETQGIALKRLRIAHALHSHLLEPMLEPFGQLFEQVTLNPPQIPYLSNVTGTWITAAEATSPGYWVEHARHPVRFVEGVTRLLQTPNWILLEVGAGESLTNLVKQHPAYTPERIGLTSLHPPQQMESDQDILLRSLATLWCHGCATEPGALYAIEQRRRVPLPTYPFERQRYWVESPAAERLEGLTERSVEGWIGIPAQSNETLSSAEPSPQSLSSALPRIADLDQWFYLPIWKRSPLPPCSVPLPEQTWLVFLDLCGLGSRFCQRLQAQGHQVITVALGDRWYAQDVLTYSLNPQHPEDYLTLFEALKTQEILPTQIWHGWALTAPALDPLVPELVQQMQHQGLHSLLAIAQAIGEVCPSQQIRLSVISNGVQDISGQEDLSPAKATLLSAVKVIPQEYAALQCSSIDLDLFTLTAGTLNDVLEQLWRELVQQPVQQEARANSRANPVAIGYRGRYRWRLDYEAMPLPPPSSLPRLRTHGVYLITGGLGGIGLTLATYLATFAQAKLILVQRSPLPPRDQRQQWLDTHPPSNPTCVKIRAIQQLEAQGAEVLVIAADIADESSLQEALQTGIAQFGRVHGVLHCAGIADFAGEIQNRSRADTDLVLASKVQGTIALDRWLRNQELDFMLLSSALSTVLHKTLWGQVGYGAANEFLNAFATYRTLQNHTLQNKTMTIAVNWTEWQEVGMAASTSYPRLRVGNQADWLLGLTPTEGQQVFERILATTYPQVVVSTQDLSQMLAQQASWDRDQLLQMLGLQMPTLALPQTVAIAPVPSDSSTRSMPSDSSTSAALPTNPVSPSSDRLLIQLHPGTNDQRDPLILVHPSSGDVTCYAPLIQALQLDRPIYGIRAAGLAGETVPLKNLRQMATQYIAALEAVQPKGTYLLGGWSMGGVLAYEMAHQLNQRGESVQGLILIDSPAPLVLQLPPETQEQLQVFCRSLGFSWKQAQQTIKALPPDDQSHTVALTHLLKQGKQAGLFPPTLDLETIQHFWRVFEGNTQALYGYKGTPYPALLQTLLLRSRDAEHKGLLMSRSIRVTDRQTEDQWKQLVGSLLPIVVPGDHYSMMGVGFVNAIAESILEFLATLYSLPA